MERNYNFTIGQKVKMFDVDDHEWCYGTVTDKTRDSVFIKWEDLSTPCEHFKDEFDSIKLNQL